MQTKQPQQKEHKRKRIKEKIISLKNSLSVFAFAFAHNR